MDCRPPVSSVFGGLVVKSCLTLVTPWTVVCQGSFVHGILQARILKWVAIPFPGALPDPGIKPRSPQLRAISLLTELQGILKFSVVKRNIVKQLHPPKRTKKSGSENPLLSETS